MPPNPPTPSEPTSPTAPAPPGGPETHAENPHQLSPLRLHSIACLSEIIAMGMEHLRLSHQRITRAAECEQAGQPAPKGPDPSIQFNREVRGVTRAIALRDRLEQNTALPVRSPADQARDAARAIRRHQEDLRSKIRHKLDTTLPNIPHSQARTIRRDIEEMLASEEVEKLLETHSIAQIVMHICYELGLAPDLSKWTDAEIGFVPKPFVYKKSNTTWIPVVNAAGMTNYFAGPPTEPVEDSDPGGPLYGFKEPDPP